MVKCRVIRFFKLKNSAMRYEDFLSMSMEQMAETVWREGRFITQRKCAKKFIKLYALDNFFVEIWFSVPHNIRDFHFVWLIKSFKGTKGIDPYIVNKESFQLMKALT